jgi:hypothetical protein
MPKMMYLIVAIGLFLLILYAVGCVPKPVPIPTPTPERPEIPPDVLALMTSPETIAQWGRRNYALNSDISWSSHKDYPQTPAEFFMNRMKCVYCLNHIIKDKPIYSGDCNTVNPLNAYFLSKLGYESYVAIIDQFSPGVDHAIAFGFKDGKMILFNNANLYTNFSNPDDWLAWKYPGLKFQSKERIESWLNRLYSQGHHRYYDEDV